MRVGSACTPAATSRGWRSGRETPPRWVPGWTWSASSWPPRRPDDVPVNFRNARGELDERGGLGLPRAEGNEIYGLYLAFVYFTPFLGGMIADIIPTFGSVNMIGGECDR